MAKGDFLGEFEYMIMLSLLRLAENAYGMTIRQDIEESTRRSVSLGAVYAGLERLERKKYIKSREGDGRGGAATARRPITRFWRAESGPCVRPGRCSGKWRREPR